MPLIPEKRTPSSGPFRVQNKLSQLVLLDVIFNSYFLMILFLYHRCSIPLNLPEAAVSSPE